MKLNHILLAVLFFVLTGCKSEGIKTSFANVGHSIGGAGRSIGEGFADTFSRSNQTVKGKLVKSIPNGKHLKKLQQLLSKKGYKVGVPDGINGNNTKKAIKAFQRDNDLKVTGIASFQLLEHLGGKIPTNLAKTITHDMEQSFANRCIGTGKSEIDALKNVIFESIVDDLEIDVTAYLAGFCVPADETKLAKLYIFLVTEGVIHSRLATTKFNELVAVFEKAGIEIAVDKDSIRRSTDELRPDIRITATDKMGGVSSLVSNSFEVEDNSSFQKELEVAYNSMESNNAYKEQARQLLAEVLTHSSSSTFYLVRSGYTIDKLSNYFGINVGDGINLLEKAKIFVWQTSKNLKLAYFLLSKQSDLSSMLISSTYNIRALTQDIKDIPRLNTRRATREVEELKREEGLTMDDVEIDFNKDNTPIALATR